VLQRRRPVLGVHDVARLAVQRGYPLGELERVGDGGREEDVAHLVRQQDHHLLPHDAALLVAHVVHLVEDDPLHLAHHLAPAVEHRAQDLRRHHEAARVHVDGHVAREQAHVAELLLELAVLLVGQRLDRRRVDHALLLAQAGRDRILGAHGLARRGVRRDEHGLVPLDARDRRLLERVQRERVRLCGHHLRVRQLEHARIRHCARRYRDLVLARLAGRLLRTAG